tara:strand:+ start:347 stop:3241 length:2895 start_codon:yes stop_codon:yes gene_type:complete
MILRKISFKFLVILIVTLFSTISSYGQEPSYSIIGEDELADLDIYTLAQDKNNFIWLGTENGLYKYDGYVFKKYTHQNLKEKSVFGFTKDNFGEIYCFNLSGQVLKIDHDSIQVFYQIPDSLLSSFYELCFDHNNNLIIAGSNPFWVDKSKKNHHYFNRNNSLFISSVKRSGSKIYFSKKVDNKFEIEIIDSLKNNSLLKFNTPNQSPKYILQNDVGYTIIKERDNFNYYDIIEDTTIFRNFNLTKSITQQYSNVCYLSPDSTLWQTTRKGNVVALNINKEKPFHKRLLFNKFYISSYLQDAENNLWLATLGKGILFIPNTKTLSFRNKTDIEDEVFTKIISTDDKIWASTQSGKIYEYKDNHFSLIYKNETKINVLKLDQKKENLIFNGSNLPYIFNLTSKKKTPFTEVGSLKEIDYINDSVILLATNQNLFFYNQQKNKIIPTDFKIPNNIGRTYSVFYQKSEHKIWLSTLKGLMIFSKTKEPEIFNNIFSTSVIEHNNSIWIATKDQGIYKFKNGKIVQQLSTKNKLTSDVIYKIIAYKNQLFISHENGIQVLNLQTSESLFFNKTSGLFTNRITDFTIQNDIVWVITNKGIQFFNYNEIDKNLTPPNIIIDKILVNKKPLNFDINKTSHFNYDENKIEISFLTTSYHHQGLLKYAYKINDYTDKWQYKSFNTNSVEFLSLQPGDYTFTVKSINENGIESVPISYHFIINSPLWKTWWFYTILVFLFIGATVIVYRYELKKQRRKIELQNELNASKLIAIQSQMNPHFIFNAITSIQDLILKGDIDNSYNYIIKFSKLVRQTLNFSDKEFIDIEEEIELLETYLELEKLRFKADFEFTIQINNAEDIKVPPMLIQPFVENAIKHGLLHKEGLKKLEISFNLNETLHCTVLDNGVGRKKGQEIKDRQQKNYQSFSVNATKIRFEIMKKHYQQGLGVFYVDLEDKGVPAGTKVVINMPFSKNY